MPRECKRKVKINIGRGRCWCLSESQTSCTCEWGVPAIFRNLTLLHSKNNLWNKHNWNFQSTVLRISFLTTVFSDKTSTFLLLYIRDCGEDLPSRFYWIYSLLTCQVLERQLHSIKAVIRVSVKGLDHAAHQFIVRDIQLSYSKHRMNPSDCRQRH